VVLVVELELVVVVAVKLGRTPKDGGEDRMGLGLWTWIVDWRNSSPLESVYDGTVGLDLCTGVPFILSVYLSVCLSHFLPVLPLRLLPNRVQLLTHGRSKVDYEDADDDDDDGE